MDGRGRLAEPLKRDESRPAAAGGGAKPSSRRPQSRRGRRAQLEATRPARSGMPGSPSGCSRCSNSGCRAAPALPPRCCSSSPARAMASSRAGISTSSSRVSRTLRDATANAAGFRIASIALAGQQQLSARKSSRSPASPGAPRCCSSTPAGARAPQGQSVDRGSDRAQALSRPPAHRDHRAPGLRAVAEGRPGRGDRRRRHRGRALRRAAFRAICRWSSAAAPRRRPSDFLALLDRYPAIRDQLRAASWSPSGAGTCGSRTASTSACRKPESSKALDTLVALDRDKKLLSRDITAIDLRLPDRVTVRLSDAAAQARDEALKDKKAKNKGGDA